jgi:hypothetical protein
MHRGGVGWWIVWRLIGEIGVHEVTFKLIIRGYGYLRKVITSMGNFRGRGLFTCSGGFR